jgi:flagellar biosynthesis chaperone FliJ
MNGGQISAEIARSVGTIASIIAIVGTAIKTGQWKGEHQERIKQLEEAIDKTARDLEHMDKRVDGIEKLLSETLTALKKDVEYIRGSLDDLKKERRRDAQA